MSDTVSKVVPLMPSQLVTVPLSWPLTHRGGPDADVVVGEVEVGSPPTLAPWAGEA